LNGFVSPNYKIFDITFPDVKSERQETKKTIMDKKQYKFLISGFQIEMSPLSVLLSNL